MLRTLILAILIMVCTQGFPQYTNQAERITLFDSHITVNTDASIDVTENISVYADDIRIIHGIVRHLPTVYTDSYGRRHSTHYQLQQLLMNNMPVAHHASYDNDEYSIYIGSHNIILKPGNYTYTIRYHINNAINFLKDGDELYWNITGNNWQFPISQAEVSIYLPEGANIMSQSAYTGRRGASGQAFTSSQESPNHISYVTTRALQPGEGLTVAVAWQKGIVHQPTMLELIKAQANAGETGVLALFIITLIYYLIVWNLFGKRPPAGTIIPQYQPPQNISPAAARYIMRMGFDSKTVTTAILSMAIKGYLTIDNSSGSFILTRQTEDDSKLSEEEKNLGKLLFSTGASIKIHRSNSKILGQIDSNLRTSLNNQYGDRYFITNLIYVFYGVLLTLAGFGFAYLSSDQTGNALFALIWMSGWSVACIAVIIAALSRIRKMLDETSISNIFNAILYSLLAIPFLGFEVAGIYFFSLFIPAFTFPMLFLTGLLNYIFYHLLRVPTVEGRRIMDQIEGFMVFLTTTERYRIVQATPNEPAIDDLEKYLPYAVALDVENEWSTNFNAYLQTTGIQPAQYHPRWYNGNIPWTGAGAVFPVALGSALGSSLASSVRVSSSASHGGGFSGGGGGGGGGGGW